MDKTVISSSIEDLLKSIYFEPQSPGSFSSSPALIQKVVKEKHGKYVPQKVITRWLTEQRPYYMHKPARQTFPRNPTYVVAKDEQWQADLLFLPDLAKFNGNTQAHLLVVDVLSRYAWIEPLKNKTGPETARAFEYILKTASPRKPKKLQTDDGKEFFNFHFGQLMRQYDIHHFSTKSDMKAAVAERLVKTIKEKIYKYLDANLNKNNHYLDVLQNLMTSYNNTFHSSIGMAPAQVTECNTGKVVWNLFHHVWRKDRGGNVKARDAQFSVGDYVRISSRKSTMSKRYKGNWTEEIFKIIRIKESVPEYLYKLADLKDEPIEGSFYSYELQKAASSDRPDKEWEIEAILDTRNVYKPAASSRVKKQVSHKEYLVKWFGYPDSFNQWIHENDLKKGGT